jgi:tetratricopeptide (TPR) repeat protein
MKRYLIQTIVAAIAFAAMSSFSGDARAITVEEVMTLARLNIPEGDIIKAIEKDRTLFDLKIQDILELKKAGVPDGVIQFMLKTPQMYGAAAPAPAPATGTAPAQATAAPAPAPTPVPVVREKTAEELAADAVRRAEEDRRRQEEARKADEARRSAYARGILRQGLSLAESGKWVEALEVFQRFTQEGNYPPGSVESYNAMYGMAAALANAKLYQSAANLLVQVLLEGPDKPFFQEAFGKLRELRREIIYNPPDLEQITKFALVGMSERFQDEFNYVMGEFFFDYGNYQRALKHFESVSMASPDKAKSLYLNALVQVNYRMYRSAVESLEQAIRLAEGTGADPAVADLAYMALARIAYESENYDAAIFYYKKVPRDSIRAGTVFYEMAWAYMMKGDYSRAIGSFHALHSPYFKKSFYPELWILEARAYGDLCRYDKAAKALDAFDTRVAFYQEPLKRFIDGQKSPDDFYLNFVASLNEVPGANRLPKVISYPVLANVEFYNLYKTIRQLENEERAIRQNQGRLGSFAKEMQVKIGVLRKDAVVRIGIKVQQLLTALDAEISEAQLQKTEIEVDINQAAIGSLTLEARALVGEDGGGDSEEETSTPIAIVGSDTAVWPFEGEYWWDEVPYFRSLLTTRCTGEEF